jgi:hypothetical protein
VPFANTYDFGGPSRFRNAIPAPVTGRAGELCLAIGELGRSGLAVLLGTDGETRWARTYMMPDGPISFHDGAVVVGGPNHGFVLLSGASGQDYVLVRIAATGQLIWTQRIRTDWTRDVVRVVPLAAAPGQEEFLLLGWGREEPGARPNVVEMIRVRANGTVARAAHLRLRSDDRIVDALPFGDGYALVGHSVRLPESSGFLVYLSATLDGARGWHLTGNDLRALALHAALLESGRLWVVGRAGTATGQMSMIAEVTAGGAGLLVDARVLSLSDNFDQPTRIAAVGNDLLLFDQPVGFVRPPTVVRFDRNLDANARYGFEFAVGVELHGLAVARNDTVLIAGVARERPGQGQALMLATDVSLHCCGTKTLPAPLPEKIAVTVSDATATVIDVDMTIPGASIVAAEVTPSVRSLCRVIEALPNQMVQSPFLALQSAGSSGVDATRGILLRWHLLGFLGERHLPKGTLALGTANFNKPDDFVTIYRAPWPGGALRERRLSFAADKPVYVDHANRLLVFETGTDTPRDLFHVSFLDAAAYEVAKASSDPGQDVAGFLTAYGAHPIEIELRHRLALACDLALIPAGAADSVRVETLGVGENRPLAPKVVTSRHVLDSGDGATPRLFAENTRSVRVACTGARLDAVAFRCYDDVLAHVNQAKDWTLIGRFALTLDRPTALLRLEDAARTPVHGRWWKFNDGAFVNVNNYRDRWVKPVDGLEAAVQQYVTLSEQDPKATAVVQGVLPEDGAISLSYLDWLQIAAVDYHVARTLGLGCIDVDVDAKTSYVYVAEYVTRGDLDDGGKAREVQHLYVSLPTSLAQSRLPIVPDLPPVEYGLSVPTANGPPYRLTDANGYTADGMIRYIRLYPDCAQLYDAGVSQGFFDSAAPFDLAERSLPVLYGVEYRKDDESTWRAPEIGHDTAYKDTAAPPVFEAMPTPFPPTHRASAFIHKETEPGIHQYAVYGINIFSRASALSQVQPTDETRFRKTNRLLPPSDLRVQLIQEELPLVLTTKDEQTLLTDLKTAADRTLVRLTCNYAHVQDANWEFADTIEILFRAAVPSNVIGGVKAVLSVPSNPDAIRIETEPYAYSSTDETVEPVLLAGKRENFLGGALVAGNQRYTIIDVTWPDATTGKDPIFLASKKTTPGVTETAAGPALIIEDVAAAIAPGSLMMAVENMAAATSWDLGTNPLTARIRIGDTSWKEHTERFTRGDGTEVTRKLRGVWENANVTEANGLYTIVFDNYVLGDHPQASDADPVTWYKGIVRVSVVGRPLDDRRALAVLRVDQSSGTLSLTAVDDTGETGAILTGPNQLVNYYPGYKLYLHADPAKGFERASVMPAPGDGSRMTMLGVRSIDNFTHDDAGDAYHSPVGIPQLLTALEVVAPEEPDKPTGLKYATPPDTEGKSSFTLTTTFKHAPFAAVFYRVDALTVLRTLYSAQTVQDIRAKIFPSDKDAFAKRWEDVFTFSGYPATIGFRPFLLDGVPYALPHPDATRFTADATTPLDQLEDKIKRAVLGVFLPLTEQPLIYSLIRSDPSYVPTNKKQRFRNDNGDVLRPGEEGFDLAPMARRSDQGTPTIRFTDFTLDGSMNPHTVYFYAVREISNQMKIGEASQVFGPVRLVNLSPPAAPVLRKISTVPYDVLAARNPEVRFEILPPSAVDPIAKVRVYRTTTAVDATTVRAMTLVKEVDVTTLVPTADRTLIVVDDFAGEAFVPYGDPLFYRLVYVRAVTYEDAGGTLVHADAASEPTRVLLASLIDIVNPRPPVPTVSRLSITPGGDKLLRLTWTKTVHNGMYYVSRLSASGNWMRLGRVKTNAESVTFDLSEPLPVDDEDGNRIYYRFKVDVENCSGLLNLVEAPITVSLDTL